MVNTRLKTTSKILGLCNNRIHGFRFGAIACCVTVLALTVPRLRVRFSASVRWEVSCGILGYIKVRQPRPGACSRE